MKKSDIIKSKINELYPILSGESTYVSFFVENKKGNFDVRKAKKLSKDLASHARTDRDDKGYLYWLEHVNRNDLVFFNEIKDEKLRCYQQMLENYFYLAISICYFFETHPDIELKLKWLAGPKFAFIGIKNFASYIDIDRWYPPRGYAHNILYDTYLYNCQVKTGIKYDIKQSYAKLLYVIISALAKKELIDVTVNEKKYIDSLNTYELEEWERMDLDEKVRTQDITLNQNIIPILEEYIEDFPAPAIFYSRYGDFISNYLCDLVGRAHLESDVKECVERFLDSNKLSIYSDNDTYKYVFNTLSMLVKNVDDIQIDLIYKRFENEHGNKEA